MSNYLFNKLEPDTIFYTVNQKQKVADANSRLDMFYKEYMDFIGNLPGRKALTFSTEELHKSHLRQLNKECFANMSKLISKYINAVNTKVDNIYPLLECIQKAAMNLELSKNINQIRSLSNESFKEVHLESVESATDIINRLDSILMVLTNLSDIKSVLTDPVRKDEDSLGKVFKTTLNNLKANKSFRFVTNQFNPDVIPEPAFGYNRSCAVHDYMTDVSLHDASYNTSSLFKIYNKLSKVCSSLENYFTKNYKDISFYNQNDSYFEKSVKSLKETYFEYDNMSTESSLPVRLMRLSSSLTLITDVILPTLFKDIKYTIEIFSRLGSTETINTSSESFKTPPVKSRMLSLSEVYKNDFSYLDKSYNKFISNLVTRASSRLNSINKKFKDDIPQRLYHCRPEDTLISPMCIDEYNKRLTFYEAIYLGASKFFNQVESEISKNKALDISDETLAMLNTYVDNIVKDTPDNLFANTTNNMSLMMTSSLYLDTLENEEKVSLESMGYSQNTINNLNINGFRDAIAKCSDTFDRLLYSVKDTKFASDSNIKNKQAPLIKSVTLLTSLLTQSKFELYFLLSICDG